jgi:hypothetical protein
MSSYDSDFFAWTQAQADALRRKSWNELDIENLTEEIDSVGRSEKHEIRSRLVVLLVHLLKWKYQPERQCGSWKGSIREARERIGYVLEDSPSLAGFPAEVLAKAYGSARRQALDETGLLRLQDDCPWTAAQVLDADFLP